MDKTLINLKNEFNDYNSKIISKICLIKLNRDFYIFDK
jgi:hypothetical protein